MRTEQIVEALLVRYMNSLKAKKELEKQLKKGHQIAEAASLVTASPFLKRDSSTLKNRVGIAGRVPRLSIMNNGAASSFKASNRNALSTPQTPLSHKLMYLRAEDTDSSKNDSQSGGLKPPEHVRSENSSGNSSPMVLRATTMRSQNTSQDSNRIFFNFSPTLTKEVIETNEKEEDEATLEAPEILDVNLPETLGLNKESEADKIIAQYSEALVSKISSARDALHRFVQNND